MLFHHIRPPEYTHRLRINASPKTEQRSRALNLWITCAISNHVDPWAGTWNTNRTGKASSGTHEVVAGGGGQRGRCVGHHRSSLIRTICTVDTEPLGRLGPSFLPSPGGTLWLLCATQKHRERESLEGKQGGGREQLGGESLPELGKNDSSLGLQLQGSVFLGASAILGEQWGSRAPVTFHHDWAYNEIYISHMSNLGFLGTLN